MHATKCEAMRIAGQEMSSDVWLSVVNPYSGMEIGSVPRGTIEDVRRAFSAAGDVRPKLTRFERRAILEQAAATLERRGEEFSQLITAESGLCRKDTTREVLRAIDVFRQAGAAAVFDDGQAFACDIGPSQPLRRVFTSRVPLQGVISAITPFNHPLNAVSHKIAPAIATNNRIVVKPSEQTPLTALMLADVLYESGLPPEMLSVVTGRPMDIGLEMVTNEHVELVTFTGSVQVGKEVAAHAGYRRVVLELGGNDPLIVLRDADLEVAADLAVRGAIQHSGQRCTAVKRVLAEECVCGELGTLIAQRTAKLKVGDPADPETDVGAVISVTAAETLRRRVADALDKGATLLCGTNVAVQATYPPVVLDRVPKDCELVIEETFGPIVPIVRCRDLDEILRVANSTRFGLSAGVCSYRLDYIARCIEGLDVGNVNVWEVPGYRIEAAPFGGVKDSGLGVKEGIIEAMKCFTTVKTYSVPWL